MSLGLKAVSGQLPANGSDKSKVVKEADHTSRVSDRVMVTVFKFLSLSGLGCSGCVSKRWVNLVSWNDNQLWTLDKLDKFLPRHWPNNKVRELDEARWRELFDCAGLGLDPSGAPQLRRSTTLKAVVAFLNVIRSDYLVWDVTLPKGLSLKTASQLGILGEKTLDPTVKTVTRSMVTYFTSIGRIDHVRGMVLVGASPSGGPGSFDDLLRDESIQLQSTTRIFTTYPDDCRDKSQKEDTPNIPSLLTNAMVRPLPSIYCLPMERSDAVFSNYPHNMSFPYLRFCEGTPQSQRLDYAPPGYYPMIRICDDAGTDYKEEAPYASMNAKKEPVDMKKESGCILS